MSTTRSFSTGRPLMGSTVMVTGLPSLGSMSLHQQLAGQTVHTVDPHRVPIHRLRVRSCDGT